MQQVKHIHSPRISVLTWHLEPLHDLFRILPKSGQTFRSTIRAANLEKGIKDTDFQFKKERILVMFYLLEKIRGLDTGQIRSLADAVLIHRDKQRVLELLKVAEKDNGSTSSGPFPFAEGYFKRTPPTSKLTKEEALWRDANNYASSVPDLRFLSGLKATQPDESLRDAVVEVEEIAHTYLRKLIESLVDEICPQIFSSQVAEGDKQIQREITSDGDKELGIIRSEFVHQVEDSSRERSRSYVCHSLE